ncbi:hypothetical protein M3G03_10185 [Aestuariimicrobium sp. p3-SID1156]|uniref:hypothetical protein n=1 Tax=Aestuariimicrobium sp. p3-SID1156 TaxID=2916038 RepID=UPI00223B9A5D|nr:hypothetical protein [Aestuariimicrobium sp. p3-SID1156]MCT1459899.1 hypothetical protein [Aestuariimicrobium sp. p3-SID1156]
MWVKFDDQTPNDPEIDALSDGAFRLWFSAICYCQAELTDGHIADNRLRRLVPNFKKSQLDELTANNGNPNGPIFQAAADGYLIRNFEKWNKTRDYWETKRAREAERIANWRARNGR